MSMTPFLVDDSIFLQPTNRWTMSFEELLSQIKGIVEHDSNPATGVSLNDILDARESPIRSPSREIDDSVNLVNIEPPVELVGDALDESSVLSTQGLGNTNANVETIVDNSTNSSTTPMDLDTNFCKSSINGSLIGSSTRPKV